MARTFLKQASLAAGFPVESEDGWLRLGEYEQPCHGYQCCCCCESCKLRAEGKERLICCCPSPLILPESTECSKCGKNLKT